MPPASRPLSSRCGCAPPASLAGRSRSGPEGPSAMPAWLDDFLWAYGSFVYGLGVNAMLGLSMYAVLALGQLSLAQAAFMGIGAYTSAVLTVRFGMPFPLVLAAAMMTPAIAAAIIGVPTLRLTGVYLAI